MPSSLISVDVGPYKELNKLDLSYPLLFQELLPDNNFDTFKCLTTPKSNPF